MLLLQKNLGFRTELMLHLEQEKFQFNIKIIWF